VRAGTGVILTRPIDQAGAVARKVEAIGGRAIRFPALEITAHAPTIETLSELHTADMAIFISANAVEFGLRAIAGKLPTSLTLAAIGKATAQALAEHGFHRTIMPEHGADSEALLASPALLQVAGKHIVIFRGVGGRETLRAVLCQRGAKVAYIECYTRRQPDVAPDEVSALLQRNDVAAIHVLSRETLENFCHIVGSPGTRRFSQTALLVPHPAVLEAARMLGFGDVLVTGFGDDGLIAALEQRFPAANP
jgi:uroporphyrinogen-III synthase